MNHRLHTFHIRLLFATLFLSSVAHTQIIDNRLGNAFQEEMYFNQEFLWQNKVKSVTGVISVKRPNRPIDQRPDVFVYRFNEVGLLIQLDKVTSVLGLVDSLRIQYTFNELGEADVRSELNRQGFFTTKFNYDKEGRVARLDYGKSENVSSQKSHLEPGQSMVINSETYSYSDADERAVRKSHFNNYGLLYSNSILTRNELGYIVSDVEELVMSNRITTRTYTYEEHGWVQMIETTDNQGSLPRREKFVYDAIGNLLKVEHYHGDQLEEETEVLYTATMLVEATLRHDLQSNDIVITKFTYEFY